MIAPFVIDASIAVSWCFADEFSPETEAIFDMLELTYVVVPALFAFELQNVLRQGERRGRVTRSGLERFWAQLASLDVQIEPYSELTPNPEIVDVARKYGLTGYDAAYLDVAIRHHLQIATLDVELRDAAAACGLGVLPVTLPPRN